MSRLHLFNPDNDLALANGSPNFTPPRSAIGLRTSGACLPMWYGCRGDYFVGAVNERWFEDISNAFGLSVEPAMIYEPGMVPEPWGWSAAARTTFLRLGVPADKLPDDSEIELMRHLSHRTTTAEVANYCYRQFPWLVGDSEPGPVIVTDAAEALETVDSMGRAMLKLPWSNAGRGQQDSGRIPRNVLIDRINGMLNRQGAIEIEPYYDRITDFAVLFDDSGQYIGLSLFTTDTHGGWTGNVLTDDSAIEEQIGTDIEPIAKSLEMALDAHVFSSGYKGPVGVDMMKAIDRTGRVVYPIVEVNVRRTMGNVAHVFHRRFMAPGVTGRLTVEPRSSEPFHVVGDCEIADGKLVSGCLDLVPPGGDFRIVVRTD